MTCRLATALRGHTATLLLTLLLGGCALPPPATPRPADWHFVALGDTPYSSFEQQRLPAMMDFLASQLPAYVVHVGDFKSGGESCEDSLLEQRVALFRRPGLAFTFTPGDNDWTDCHRASNGGYDPLERLDFLRRRFFTPDAPASVLLPGADSQATRMPAYPYPENQRWRRGAVLFVSLNVPGGHNNRGVATRPSAEFLARGEANRAWLADSFAQARADRSIRAVVIFMQGDPGFAAFARNAPPPGYTPLLMQLQYLAGSWSGEVLLIHGDTHWPQIDQPMPDPEQPERTLPRFTRAIVPGSPSTGWIRGLVRESGRPVVELQHVTDPAIRPASSPQDHP